MSWYCSKLQCWFVVVLRNRIYDVIIIVIGPIFGITYSFSQKKLIRQQFSAFRYVSWSSACFEDSKSDINTNLFYCIWKNPGAWIDPSPVENENITKRMLFNWASPLGLSVLLFTYHTSILVSNDWALYNNKAVNFSMFRWSFSSLSFWTSQMSSSS